MSRRRRAATARGPFAMRKAVVADAAAILALEQNFHSDRMSSASVRRFLRVPSAQLRVISDASCAVVAALVLLTRKNSSVARLYSIVVSPSARGHGLAQRLVRAAERDARTLGRTRIALEVRSDNLAARALYAKLGYAEIASLPGYYDDGSAGLRLGKNL